MFGYIQTIARFQRNGKLILTYTLAKGISLALQGLIYNLFLASLHYSSAMIGVLDAMAPVTVLLVSLPLGLLADRFGRKNLLVVCGFLGPLTVIGLALFTQVGWQIAFGLAGGIVGSFYWVAYPAIIVESSTDDDRQHLFAVNSTLMLGVGSLGYLLGGGVTVLVGAALHQSPDATAPLRVGLLLVSAINWLGAAPLLWLREPGHERRHEQARRSYDLWLFARLLIPDGLLSFGAGAILSFNQLFFVSTFGLSAGAVGLFLAIAGVAGSIGALTSPVLTRRLGTARAAIALQGASVPLMSALALAPAAGAALAVYTVWAFIRSGIDPTYTGFTMEQVPASQRSTLSGLYSVTWAVGFGIGPIATGWLHGATGRFTAPFLLAAACYGVATVALYLFFGRRVRAATAAAKSPAAR